MFQNLFKKVTLSGVIVLLVLVISLSGKYQGQASSGASTPENYLQNQSAHVTERNLISSAHNPTGAEMLKADDENETPDEEEKDLLESKDEEQVKNSTSEKKDKTSSEPASKVKQTPSTSKSTASKAKSAPVEKAAEEPKVREEVKEEVEEAEQVEDKKEEVAPEPEPKPAAPVTYSYGSSHKVRFRAEVEVTNNGSEVSKNVRVSIPMLENKSPYQKTSLSSTSYPVSSSSGRVSTFNIGDLEPGETKTVVCDYNITIRPVSINSTNDTVEKAREAYNRYAGSGNCHTLAVGFVNHCKSLGVKARVVTGFARPQRGKMTSGSLAGCRHSWAEFYVDGLGWVPVDLTFKYFGDFPHASHVVETYRDQSISVKHSGGSLGVVWKNSIR